VSDGFVSVLLPVRNGAATLGAALAGLLAEDDAAREVVAVDDGSTDATWAVLCEAAARDARLRPLRGDGAGLVAALQRAAAAARGSLLARMDADDVAAPERLGRQRTRLLTAPGVAALGTRVEAFADGGEVGEGLRLYVAWLNDIVTAEQHAAARFVESPLCHPSVMLRRSAVEAVGGYRGFDGPEDYDLFLRLCAAGWSLEKLPQVLLGWRHTPGRSTFADPRYALARFRETKAPHLAAEVARAERAGKRFVMWGAGRTGKLLARDLARHGVRPACFVDIDPLKIGRTARGAPIVRAEALDAERDFVVAAVGARGARALIGAELDRRGFREGETYFFAS
jgi:GT2 family glycosyltransferase